MLLPGNVPVLGSFWDFQTTGLDTSVGGGTKKKTSAMKTFATFNDR